MSLNVRASNCGSESVCSATGHGLLGSRNSGSLTTFIPCHSWTSTLHTIPTSQGRLEIKYLCREECLGGEACWLSLASPLGNSLAWRMLFWAYVIIGHVFQVRNLAGSWESPKPQVCAHRVSRSQPALPYQTSWHGFVSHVIGQKDAQMYSESCLKKET